MDAAVAQRPTRRAALRLLAGSLFSGLLARRETAPARAQDQPVQIDIVTLPPNRIDFGACGVQGLTDCGGVCVDIEIDLNNCGGCGLVCGAGAGCFGGTCVAPPSAACASLVLTDCGGTCVNLASHAGHCGACFNSCPLGGVCEGGFCTG